MLTLIHVCGLHDPSIREVCIILNVIEKLNKILYIFSQSVNGALSI